MKKEEKKFWGYIIGCICSFVLMIVLLSNIQLKVSRETGYVILYLFTFTCLFFVIMALLTFSKNPTLFKEKKKNNSAQLTKEKNAIELQEREKMKKDKNQIKCPHCQSTSVQFMGNNKKGFSIGKAAAGTVLTGGIGALAGFAGKKGKNQWFCQNCNQVFETKK